MSIIHPGQYLYVPAGKFVRKAGKLSKRKTGGFVTVTKVETARDGRIRACWKSNGVKASTLV